MTDQSSAALRDRILELETRIRRIEGFLGTPLEPPVVPLFETLQTVGKLQTSVNEIPAFIKGRIISVAEDLSVLQDAIDLKLDAVNIEMGIVKRAVGGGSSSSEPSSKFKVQDLKPFKGERSSKELENFLWDMEAYFQAARVPDSEKVSITRMYLAGDAKLWWRSRLSDVDTGATHNFIADRVVQKLGLDLDEYDGQVKAINTELGPVKGVARTILKVGDWDVFCCFMAVPMDDYDLILGNKFLVALKAMVAPQMGGLYLRDEDSSCFVKGEVIPEAKPGKKGKKGQVANACLSTLVLNEGVRKKKGRGGKKKKRAMEVNTLDVPSEVAGKTTEIVWLEQVDRMREFMSRRWIDVLRKGKGKLEEHITMIDCYQVFDPCTWVYIVESASPDV
ncbi:hypothetical protein BUALT_Bualt02G0122800 [Buddleja alternifolia]|uniref:Retrotransposon gag domain-containing protein n=1 Tax=Buddleja alternifolia TaxID=168488 RepID=A0AAV6Y1Q6_9LAMI|nr:hypothetical protein BUALT_Bualt02G0122800 [Buddleja alternifolia]